MRSILISIICLLTINYFFQSCANPSTINGGPQDTIPPVLLEVIPPNGQLNFSGNTLTMIFSENINADRLKQELIITPYIENEFKFTTKKEMLEIEFENSFPDSTTFILNFADGVGDLNENNPVVNLKYAFSTGHFIDSLVLTGYVYDLLSNQPAENTLISLYDNDTLSIFEDKPKYFAYTDEEGLFTIENIKGGQYHVYAIEDENKNLILEPTTERHGLLTDTLMLDSALTQIEIPIILQDASQLELVRTRSQLNRFDVRYSKYIDDFEITPFDSSQLIYDRILIDNNSTLRFYPSPSPTSDSLGYVVSTKDSLGNSISDSVFIKFEGTSGRIEPFEYTLNNTIVGASFDSVLFTITANKPIKLFDPSRIVIQVDTIILPIHIDSTSEYRTNAIKSEIQFSLPLVHTQVNQYLDSTSTTLQADTSRIQQDSAFAASVDYFSRIKKNEYLLNFQTTWMISIEKDTAEGQMLSIPKPVKTDLGLIRGAIYTTANSYFIELINSSNQTVRSLYNPKDQFEFQEVRPGKYSIRVKIDQDEDGVWSFGNINKHIAPEPIYYLEETFEVRANWELEGINLSF